MTQACLQELPYGKSSFEFLKETNSIYVDKTDLIYELARHNATVFLARPRRFGKSLLVSTLESLFKHGLRDFHGLHIETRWEDKTYSVVHMDFSEIDEFSTTDEFSVRFLKKIRSEFQKVGFRTNGDLDDFFVDLSNWLGSLPIRTLVILIDECDAPLTACLHDSTLFNHVRSVLGRLFSIIKSKNGCMRFFFMTGITRYSNTSIFSAFNNLEDITLERRYGTLLGYTEEELHAYFQPYIDRATRVLGLKESELMTKLRQQYNGFSFDEDAKTRVYCPWSVLKFFKSPERGFQNYWYQSGGQPSVLMQYLKKQSLADPREYDQRQTVTVQQLRTSVEYDKMPIIPLLTMAGYLTIKKVVVPGIFEVGYPNLEVSASMAELYADELLRGQDRLSLGIPFLSSVMANGSLDDVVRHFNKAFAGLDYRSYPIVNEASCRAFLQILLVGAAMIPRPEVHSALGRSDLEVETGRRYWVFELKFAKEPDHANHLLAEGVRQTSERQYGSALLKDRELLRAVLVFDKQSRQFTRYQTVS